jgi:4-alpha-glucanotransferase
LAIAPLQDLLNLGSDARLNQPGQAEGNWLWRCTAAMLTSVMWQWLRDLTLASNRALAFAPNPATAVKTVIATKSAVLGRAA